MDYILKNVPEYTEAEARLQTKVAGWQQKLDALSKEIEAMKIDLSNEKALLTKDLIAEREEDIAIRELDFKNLQASYFGPNGDLYILRKQMVQPVQDQIYTAVQEIAKLKQYDFIVDKTSELIMLFANDKYDVSELVLNRIVKGRKSVEIEERKIQRQEEQSKAKERAKTKAEIRQANNEALREKIKKQNEERALKRKQAIEAAAAKRKQRLEEIEKRKKERENSTKKEDN
ncbi:OmpH family outer membrane protein [Flavobacteriaceae bacterium F08102]|nr:OmpH family outer membrane protein [Flavobacteriaceae bacterium F08102]